jgi:hypothetical protein
MALPADLDVTQAYDESEREALATLEREAGLGGEAGKSDIPGHYFSRDYIPSDESEQDEAQRNYLAETSRASERQGPRDFIPAAEAPVDRTAEEKQAYALQASIKWQEKYRVRLHEKAVADILKLPESTLIMVMQGMGSSDRNVYLQEEKELKNRDRIFQLFGQPVYTDDELRDRAQAIVDLPPDAIPAESLAQDAPDDQDPDTVDKNTFIPEAEDITDDLEAEPDVTGIEQGGKDE